MQRILKKPARIIQIVFVLATVIVVLLLLAVKQLNECDVNSYPSLLCEQWNHLRAILLSYHTALLVSIIGSIIVAILAWLADTSYSKINPLPPIREAQFPFQQMEASQLLEAISNFPPFEVSYIHREQEQAAASLTSLKNEPRILIAGVSGSGKTREAIELIKLIDSPPGIALVFRPQYHVIEETFQWPTNIQFRQRPVVLLLDNLEDFEAADDDGQYRLGENATDFERVMSRVLRRFRERCDDLRVISTVRSDTEAWKKLSKRLGTNFWQEFRIIDLPRHTWNEAIQYCTALDAKLPNIQLSRTATKSLADTLFLRK